MKFLKYFESEKQSREVNLTELFNTYIKFKYMSKSNTLHLTDPDVYFWNSDYSNISEDFNKNVLLPLLLDKEIEFPKVVHPYDDEVIYSFSGRVKDVRLDITNRYIYFIVYLYDEKNAYHLLTIPWNHKPDSCIVKIYNSEPIDIEDELNMFLNVTKYNL